MDKQWLCFFELGGPGESAYLISAKSMDQIKKKYPGLFILEHGKTLEEMFNAPVPEDPERRYKQLSDRVHPGNRVNVDSEPNFELTFHYSVPRGMSLFFCKYVNANDEVRFPKIFAHSESQLKARFANIELVKPPVELTPESRPFQFTPVFCLDFEKSLLDFLEN